ncbi:MAG: hypothetical protein MZW92_64080 [Comamonadaceae bacterium]|nr:hypothetical protein [Comamonadaceae bacterium]
MTLVAATWPRSPRPSPCRASRCAVIQPEPVLGLGLQHRGHSRGGPGPPLRP